MKEEENRDSGKSRWIKNMRGSFMSRLGRIRKDGMSKAKQNNIKGLLLLTLTPQNVSDILRKILLPYPALIEAPKQRPVDTRPSPIPTSTTEKDSD
jgi:hypothetical protein